MDILVTTGIPVEQVHSVRASQKESFLRFKRGEIVALRWGEKNPVYSTIKYTSPPSHGHPAVTLFKCGEIVNGRLNVVTNTEIVIYDMRTWEIENIITHSLFNDVHSVMQDGENYWVANTGMETVHVVSSKGEILAEYNTTDIPTWERFDKTVDYRFIPVTKPHHVHPNFIFRSESNTYVTRFFQKDAVCLEDSTKRFDIKVGNPHDGVLFEGKVYFTTTNGYVVIFDSITRQRTGCFNLKEMIKDGRGGAGWYRGVCPLPDNHVIVGITRLRNSKFREYGGWIKNLKTPPPTSRLLEFDLTTGAVVNEFIYPHSEGAAIFSVLHGNRQPGCSH